MAAAYNQENIAADAMGRPLMAVVVNGLNTKSDKIRSLSDAGYTRSEITKYLEIRYQHVRNVLVARDGKPANKSVKKTRPKQKGLSTETILEGGFQKADSWNLVDGEIRITDKVSSAAAVYAFTINGKAVYVGKASRDLRQRLYFYAKPGAQQKTNHRLNALIKENLQQGLPVDIYMAMPGETEWNGLPVDVVDGLEAGLIRNFDIPWNIQGSAG